MSHEVNNSVGASNSLLNSCLNYARELPREHRSDFAAALSIAIARTDQLNAFMRSFADVIRLPAPARVPCEVREVMAGVERLVRPQCAERRVEWRWEIEEEPGRVSMDRAQMEQVFLNVTKNALEAIGADGTITVRFLRRDGRPAMVGRRQRTRALRRGAPEPLHALLQHQGARPGHRPDARAGNPQPAPLPGTRSTARPADPRSSRSCSSRDQGSGIRDRGSGSLSREQRTTGKCPFAPWRSGQLPSETARRPYWLLAKNAMMITTIANSSTIPRSSTGSSGTGRQSRPCSRWPRPGRRLRQYV